MARSFVLLLFLNSVTTYGYRFDCMRKCICDTEDEAIHCHNLGLIEVPFPENGRLRGFTVLGMTGNEIENLPRENQLKKYYPDLLAIDIEGNRAFKCETMAKFSKIKVFSDCFNDTIAWIRANRDRIIPLIGNSTANCDVKCEMDKNLVNLKRYIIELWAKLKNAISKVDGVKVVGELRQFFEKIVRTIKALN